MSTPEILITPTDEFALVKGIAVRVWNGTTADGHSCKVLVCSVGFPEGQPTDSLEAELLRLPGPVLGISRVANPERN